VTPRSDAQKDGKKYRRLKAMRRTSSEGGGIKSGKRYPHDGRTSKRTRGRKTKIAKKRVGTLERNWVKSQVSFKPFHCIENGEEKNGTGGTRIVKKNWREEGRGTCLTQRKERNKKRTLQ